MVLLFFYDVILEIMVRSKWKPNLLLDYNKDIFQTRKGIFINSRNKVLSKHILENKLSFLLHNGKNYVLMDNLKGRGDLGCFKLGDFCYTKKRCMPPMKKRRKKK